MEHERIIYIYDYLCRNTDEEHSASCKDIQNYLAKTANHGGTLTDCVQPAMIFVG